MNRKFKLNYFNGVYPALRLKDEFDYSLKTPGFTPQDYLWTKPIAGIIHIYYVDLLPEICSYLGNFPVTPDLYISTDSQEKFEGIANFLSHNYAGKFVIKIVPNRGRDIAPMLVDFKNVFYEYEYCFHIHTKKTLHYSSVANWRKYLLSTLMGSNEIVESNLFLLSIPDVGFIFPQNINVYRHGLSWGCGFNDVQDLLLKAHILLKRSSLLEFPSGSMFFARTDSIRKLCACNFNYESFDIENNQVTGTLAHDIETSLLYFVEYSGYKWLKVSINHGNVLSYVSLKELNEAIKKSQIKLLDDYSFIFNELLNKKKSNNFVKVLLRKIFNAYQKVAFKMWSPRKLEK